MDKVIQVFWWGKQEDEGEYITPISWDNICQHQEYGGLGMRKIADFNKAILSKMA